jgi:crotonobetainyl-CoA:carnitine CoA-transferase CaiB-like acyl-CoA transferase
MVAFNTTSTTAYSLFNETTWEMRKKRPRDPSRIWGKFEVQDGWIQVAGERPRAIDRLRELLGVEEINRDLIADHVKEMTRKQAFDFLAGVGMPVAPIYDSHETFADPHLQARGFWVEVDHSVAGSYTVPNFPVKLSETPGEVTMAAPMLGQHTEEVLTTLLGYTPERVRDLEKEGKVVCWRAPERS